MTAEHPDVERLQRNLADANSSIEALTTRIHELVLERGRMINTTTNLSTELDSCRLKLELNQAGLLSDDEV